MNQTLEKPMNPMIKRFNVLKINMKKEGLKLSVSTQYKSPFKFKGQPILLSQVRSRFPKEAMREHWFVKLANAESWTGSFGSLRDALNVYLHP